MSALVVCGSGFPFWMCWFCCVCVFSLDCFFFSGGITPWFCLDFASSVLVCPWLIPAEPCANPAEPCANPAEGWISRLERFFGGLFFFFADRFLFFLGVLCGFLLVFCGFIHALSLRNPALSLRNPALSLRNPALSLRDPCGGLDFLVRLVILSAFFVFSPDCFLYFYGGYFRFGSGILVVIPALTLRYPCGSLRYPCGTLRYPCGPLFSDQFPIRFFAQGKV